MYNHNYGCPAHAVSFGGSKVITILRLQKYFYYNFSKDLLSKRKYSRQMLLFVKYAAFAPDYVNISKHSVGAEFI